MENLSIIVPLDFSRRPLDLIKRAIRLIKFFEPYQIELIFSIANRGGLIENQISQKILKYKHTVLVYDKNTRNKLPPLARLRNLGAAKATRPYLLFLDVDVLISYGMLKKTIDKIITKKMPYVAIPVVYLSKLGSKKYYNAIHQASDWYLSLQSRLVDGIAINSSLIMICKSYFLNLGGFHDSYSGHGFEDFDFLLRALDISKKKQLVSENFFIDRTSHSPAQAWGFRAFLTQYSLPIFLENIFAVHLHHDRCQGDGYYEQRKNNFENFKHRLQKYFLVSNSPQPHPNVFTPTWTNNLFLNALHEHQKNKLDYQALFQWNGVEKKTRLYRLKRRVFYYAGMSVSTLNVSIGRYCLPKRQ